MASATIRQRCHAIGYKFSMCALLFIFLACGGDTGNSPPESNDTHTGSIAIQVALKNNPTQDLTSEALSPSGDICADYGIDRIDGQVLDSSGAVVATEKFDCSEHQGVFNNIPVGIVSVDIVGVVNDNADWQGGSPHIEVIAGADPDPVQIELQYSGTDAEPPEVTVTDPADAAASVATNKVIVVVFNENVVEATLNTGSFRLNDGVMDVPGSVVWDPYLRQATFTPASLLTPATTYRATITEDIFDKHANKMAVPFSWTFTTSTVDMGVELTNDPVFGSGSVVQDASNHLEFLRLDFTTPYTYNEILAELNTGGDFEGWRIASAADLMLLGGSANIVQGHTEALMLARADLLRDWFCVDCVNLSTTHEVVRGLISDIHTGTDSQQAFSIGRRLNVTPNDVDFRVSGYGGPDDRGEEVFLVRSTLDAVPPYVSSTAPDRGEVNVAANRQITVTFSERIDSSTITATSFLVNDGTTNIDGQLSSNGTMATFIPAALNNNTLYTVTITSAVRDIAGNRMQSNYIYSFTTSGDILGVQLADSADFGPNSVIRDVSHRLEFLRLDFTTPYTYNEILAELNTGGAFEGWRIATGAEVALLGDSANIVMGSTDVEMLARVEQLRDWFCIDCVNLSTTHEYIRGLISDIYTGTDGQVFQNTFSMGRRFNVTPNEVDFRVSGYGGQDNRSEEVFLVRDIYYAPASLSTADEAEK